MSSSPLVSISCLTFNHGQYLRTCLDGFLMQNTTFEFEVLIHDDASTDNTREIIEEYVARFPNKFFPIFQQENQYSKGVRGMMPRFNFPRARGKYIALCEGDDYWTDPYKLQKQVAFLEMNPEYVLCFHRSNVLQNEKLLPDPLEERYNRITNFPVSKLDLLQQSNFIQTHSVVFRNVVSEFPRELGSSPAGDLLLYTELTNHGYIHRIDDVMGVYRMGSGVYSTLDPFNLRRQKMKIEISILSMLSDPSEKQIMRERIFHSIDSMKNPLAEANRFDAIKDVVSLKLMIRLFLYKLKKFFRLQRVRNENAR